MFSPPDFSLKPKEGESAADFADRLIASSGIGALTPEDLDAKPARAWRTGRGSTHHHNPRDGGKRLPIPPLHSAAAALHADDNMDNILNSALDECEAVGDDAGAGAAAEGGGSLGDGMNTMDDESVRQEGNGLFKAKDWAGALKCYDLCIERSAGNVKALANRAAALLMMKRPAGAILACDKVLALKPKHAKATSRRLKAFMSLEDANREKDSMSLMVEVMADPDFHAFVEAYPELHKKAKAGIAKAAASGEMGDTGSQNLNPAQLVSMMKVAQNLLATNPNFKEMAQKSMYDPDIYKKNPALAETTLNIHKMSQSGQIDLEAISKQLGLDTM